MTRIGATPTPPLTPFLKVPPTRPADSSSPAASEILAITPHDSIPIHRQPRPARAPSSCRECQTRAGLVTAVTWPFLRYHPAIIAQAAATVACLSGGRLTLGLGAGEALNEHVVGRRWPPPRLRRAMLAEAIAVLRLLWQGGRQSY